MEAAVSVIDPYKEPLTRKRILNNKIRNAVPIHVKSEHRERGQVRREADVTDTMRSEMNFYSEAFVIVNKKRAICVLVVIEIGSSYRWAKQGICGGPAGPQTRECVAQSFLCIENACCGEQQDESEYFVQTTTTCHSLRPGISMLCRLYPGSRCTHMADWGRVTKEFEYVLLTQNSTLFCLEHPIKFVEAMVRSRDRTTYG
jgi:hypothetical protein